MLGLSELKQTRVYQEALEEGKVEGKQKLCFKVIRHWYEFTTNC
jgi:predicted transposase YdaD